MDSSRQALGGGLQTYCAGRPPQLQLQGLCHNMVPIALHDGTSVTLSPQHICASTECTTLATLQLQGMQPQHVSTMLATATGCSCPTLLQGGTLVLPSGQQHSQQDSSAAPLVLQPLQQQQQAMVSPLGVGVCSASPNGASVLALQSSAGNQQLQQQPLSVGPLSQQQLLRQQPQLQQPSQLPPQYQVLVLGSGELVCASAPVRQQSHAISSPASACSGSAGHSVQVLSSTQGLSCAAGQQLQQEVVQQRELSRQQVMCAPGSTVHDVHPAQYELGLVMTDAGMQVQIVPAQAVQGLTMEGTVVTQVKIMTSLALCHAPQELLWCFTVAWHAHRQLDSAIACNSSIIN